MANEDSRVRIHSILEKTVANGPGVRSTVWFQGCSIRCAGCWNPETLNEESGESYQVADLARRLGLLDTEGVTLSGGEPLDQFEEAMALGRILKTWGKSVIVFSGYTWAEISDLSSSLELANSFDSLILGPYQRSGKNLSSIRNLRHKEIIHLSGIYSDADFADIPSCEVVVTDSEIVLTGLDVPRKVFRKA